MEMVLFINSRCKTKPSMPRTSNLTMLNAIPFYELPVQTLLRDDPANFTPTPFNGYSINELSQVLFSPILLSLVTSVESCYLKKGKCTSRALFQIIQAGNGGQQPILPISLFFFFSISRGRLQRRFTSIARAAADAYLASHQSIHSSIIIGEANCNSLAPARIRKLEKGYTKPDLLFFFLFLSR